MNSAAPSQIESVVETALDAEDLEQIARSR
jgi:hypothetical protein